MAAGVIDARPLVSHAVPLADFKQVFDEFAAGRTMKAQVIPPNA